MSKQRSREYQYGDSLNALPPEERAKQVRQRLIGQSGPAPRGDEPWTEVLERSFRSANPQQRLQWNQTILEILSDYSLGTRWSQSIEDNPNHRAIWLGTIYLASRIPWLDSNHLTGMARDLESLLNTWLLEIVKGTAPKPIVIESHLPYHPLPEADPIQGLLRMSSKLCQWQLDMVSVLWNLSLEYEGVHEKTVRAGRLWELARWVALQNSQQQLAKNVEIQWLGARWEALNKALIAANHWPSSLTHLLFIIDSTLAKQYDSDVAQAHVARLIMATQPIQDEEQRLPLVKALDYFGPGHQKAREHLYQIRDEPGQLSVRNKILDTDSKVIPVPFTPEKSTQFLRAMNQPNFSSTNIQARMSNGQNG